MPSDHGCLEHGRNEITPHGCLNWHICVRFNTINKALVNQGLTMQQTTCTCQGCLPSLFRVRISTCTYLYPYPHDFSSKVCAVEKAIKNVLQSCTLKNVLSPRFIDPINTPKRVSMSIQVLQEGSESDDILQVWAKLEISPTKFNTKLFGEGALNLFYFVATFLIAPFLD